VAQPLQAAGDPLAAGRGLKENARPRPVAEHGGEALGLRVDPALDQFAVLGEDADLAFPVTVR
jgi:hypothetical protein